MAYLESHIAREARENLREYVVSAASTDERRDPTHISAQVENVWTTAAAEFLLAVVDPGIQQWARDRFIDPRTKQPRTNTGWFLLIDVIGNPNYPAQLRARRAWLR